MAGHGPGSRTGKKCKDHEGREFKSVAEMCRYWGVTATSYASRIRRGMSVERALTDAPKNGPGTPCTDHLGTRYQSQADMFRTWGVSYTVYHYRMDVLGWDQKTSLETPPGDTDLAGAHACRDHLGNEFPSKKAMCEYWHVPRTIYFTRRKAGKTLAECLAPVDGRKRAGTKPVRDHAGREYPSLDDMCAAWGILKSDYAQNIRNGLDLGRALTERTARPKRPKDHTGAEWPSINAMCKAWGIDKTVLRSRLELGWTLEQILTHPEDSSHTIKCRDHLGNEYDSQREMLAAWGVTHGTFKHRQARGHTLQACLDPGSLHAQPCRDHEGREFPCLQAMLEYWCCQVPNWHYRTKRMGMPVGEALTVLTPDAALPCGMRIGKSYGGKWHMVSLSGKEMLLHRDAVISVAREASLGQEIAAGSLPGGMRAHKISGKWYLVSGTPGTGPAPGAVMTADDAWLERCMAKYGPKPKKSVIPPSGRKRRASA